MTRAVLVDDHRLVELGIAALLQAHGVEVVAVEHSFDAGLRSVVALRPDIVVCDVVFGQEPMGLGFPIALSATSAGGTPVLLLSAFGTAYFVSQARKNGAAGYLTKDTDPAELVAALEHVAEGGTAFPDDWSNERPISDHELAIVRMVAEGLSNKEIGGRLLCSPRTVETHIERLFARCGCHDRTALVDGAARRGWVVRLPEGSGTTS